MKLDTSKVGREFENYLGLEENTRIIFSGTFGIGKTTFLKDYFKNNNRYLPLHLFPVNYSVASNEDIFELIKVDLLHSLLHLTTLDKLSISNWDALLLSDAKDQYAIFKGLINLFGKIGKSVEPILPGLESLLSSLKAAIKNSKERIEKDEGKTIKEFFKEIEATSGNIYERNVITELITQIVHKLKTEKKKEVVLIIDDLDRIDPEHIFRLLNVFAAHFDLQSGENKFGIDKVIFCCDVQNIRNIFHHKYGLDVDFNGYIDKFYTRGVFDFDNRAILLDNLYQIVSAIQPKNRAHLDIFDSSHHGHHFLMYVLEQLVTSRSINLRMIMKFIGKIYKKKVGIFTFYGKSVSSDGIYIVAPLYHLIDLFGDIESLISAIEKTPMPIFLDDRHMSSFVGYTLLLADAKAHRFVPIDGAVYGDFRYRINDDLRPMPTHYKEREIKGLEILIDFSPLLVSAIRGLKEATFQV